MPVSSGNRIPQTSEGIPEQGSFLPNDGDNVEPVGVLSEIMISDELFGSTAQDLLFPPIHKFPGLAEFPGTAHLHLDKNKDAIFKSNDVKLT